MRTHWAFLLALIALACPGCRSIRVDAPTPVAYLAPIQTSMPVVFVVPPEVAAQEYEMRTGTSRMSGKRFVKIGAALVDYVDAILVPHFSSAIRAQVDSGAGPVVILSVADFSVNVNDHRVYVAIRANHRTANGAWVTREFAGDSPPYNRKRGAVRGLKAAVRSNTDHALRAALEDLTLWLAG